MKRFWRFIKGNRSFSYNPKCVPYIKLQGLHELHEILFINDKYCDPWPFLISKYYEVLLMLFSLDWMFMYGV